MTDRPILFSAPMVRALLAGRKTQTRRFLDLSCDYPPAIVQDGAVVAFDEHEREYRWPRTHAVSDRLYVREHWRTESRAYDDLSPSDMDADYPVIYEADGDWSLNKSVGRFRQGMHMPKWASRLTLIVTDVRVERLQDISEEDACAEGLGYMWTEENEEDLDRPVVSARQGFAHIWGTINGAGSWQSNPWVVAYGFRVIPQNIGEIAK